MRPQSPCLPELHQQVAAALRRQPDIPWDIAVANMARKALREEGTFEHCDHPGSDGAPLLPLEAVVKAIAVRCHQPRGRRRKMDWQ